ncbi:MAG: GGDEF domain-containing protein [Vicinamibacterales bacterium]
MRLTTGGETGRSHAQPPPSIGAATASVVLLIALLLVLTLDQSTGSAPVQHLYYAPIIFAAIRFGFGGGLATSFAAVILYHIANPRLLAFEHEHWDVVQVVLFVAVGLVTARLTVDKRRLYALASTDDLTGLHNLRSFEQRLVAMVRSCRQAGVPLTVLVLDVDRLKSLNDTHGHLAGAEAVRTVGWLIASRLPSDAVACRYGGDEFVIALPRCTETGGRAFADTLRHTVYAAAPVLAGLPFPVRTLSVSVGVACQTFDSRVGRDDAEQGEELFRAADRALYQAKQLGRNHVCVA